MINKRGQVTIFIIIAIIIIAAVSLYFIFREKISVDDIDYVEAFPVQSFVQECLETTSKQTLYFIGLHGGYYIPPEESTIYGVPYYLYSEEYLIPSINKIENEISDFIEGSLIVCVDEFKDFQEFNITQGEIKTRTSIEKDFVSIKVDYPLTIEREGIVSRIEEFEVEVPVRLNTLYYASEFILNSHFENDGELCLSCLLDYQEENSLQIQMQSNEEDIVYEIIDTLSTLKIIEDIFEPENYKFRFAIKY